MAEAMDGCKGASLVRFRIHAEYLGCAFSWEHPPVLAYRVEIALLQAPISLLALPWGE